MDGCITNDGDVFLYGAKTVYRNFSINSKVCLQENYSYPIFSENNIILVLLMALSYVCYSNNCLSKNKSEVNTPDGHQQLSELSGKATQD